MQYSREVKQQQQQQISLSSQQRPRPEALQYEHPSTPQGQPSTPLGARAAVNRQPTESGSLYYGDQSQQNASTRTPTRDTVPPAPSHSLAGPSPMDDQSAQGPVYLDPEYRSMNPRYGKNNEQPVWGLAKPLPRVVRPGMRRDEHTQQETYDTKPRGEAEAAPELGATPELSNSSSNATDTPATHLLHRRNILPLMHLRPSRELQWNMPYMEPSPMACCGQWKTTIALFIGLTGTLAISTGGTNAGTKLSENWSWGLGSMVDIYLAGGVSGAHLNPGISIALWIFRGFPGRRCCYYVIAQVLGAITAAGLAYCIYRDSIVTFVPTASAALRRHSSLSSLLMRFFCVIFAMGDDSNAPPGAGMRSFVIGLVIYVLCICLGFNTGGCLNPMRDFGPRLVALMVGYGGETFTARNGWWFWGGWVATISGCLVGAVLYDTFIFIGGESPINYAPRRRMRAKLKEETKWRHRFGIGKCKIPSLEEGIKKLED
ncbi:Glycerol uptake facilitator protein [Penicillium canescens]|nr:Glycerol uptake facilitator protein [Penicillium canescens]